MAIVDGGFRTGGGAMRFSAGLTPLSGERAKARSTGAMKGRYVGDAGLLQTSGVLSGYLNPTTWSMPLKPGAIALRALAESSTTGALAGGIEASLAMAGSGVSTLTLIGVADATLSLNAALSPSLDLQALALLEISLAGQATTSFSILGALNGDLSLSASLASSYTLTGSAALDLSIAAASTATLAPTGAAQLVLTLSGVGTLSPEAIGALFLDLSLNATSAFAADLAAIGYLELDLQAELTTDLQRTAQGNLELHITQSSGGLDTAAVAAAVWSYPTALSLIDAVALIRKVTNNRLEIDFTRQLLVLFDDDGVTELRAWDLETDQGESVTTVRGSQTKRGVPTDL